MTPRPCKRINQDLRAYASLLIFAISLYIVMYSPQAMLKTISDDLGSGMTETGMLIGIFMFSLAISPLFVGILLDKIGVRRVLLASASMLAASSVLLYNATSFGWLMSVRFLQALIMPVGLTAIMASISALFRHLDLSRALAGYVACSLLGSLIGRLVGGWLCDMFGWRATLSAFTLTMLIALVIIYLFLRDRSSHIGRLHTPAEYMSVFSIPGVPSLLYAEACGIFVFAGMGNLLPFRMAELGALHSSQVGLMYLGYAIGLFIALFIKYLVRLFRGAKPLIALAAILYAVSVVLILTESFYVLFFAIWCLAVMEFIIHGLCPGIINKRTAATFDRGIVNALYLSCYYMGGVIGSSVPVYIYSQFGWFGAYLCLQIVLVSSCLVILRTCHKYSELFVVRY